MYHCQVWQCPVKLVAWQVQVEKIGHGFKRSFWDRPLKTISAESCSFEVHHVTSLWNGKDPLNLLPLKSSVKSISDWTPYWGNSPSNALSWTSLLVSSSVKRMLKKWTSWTNKCIQRGNVSNCWWYRAYNWCTLESHACKVAKNIAILMRGIWKTVDEVKTLHPTPIAIVLYVARKRRIYVPPSQVSLKAGGLIPCSQKVF